MSNFATIGRKEGVIHKNKMQMVERSPDGTVIYTCALHKTNMKTHPKFGSRRLFRLHLMKHPEHLDHK